MCIAIAFAEGSKTEFSIAAEQSLYTRKPRKGKGKGESKK